MLLICYAINVVVAFNFTTRWIKQPKDHFISIIDSTTTTTSSKESTYFYQRVLTNFDSYKDVIFFYFGNESPVELYSDHTGLMLENYKHFHAGVVFAEHRYYGKSKVDCSLKYLRTEQALEDFAVVLQKLKMEYKPKAIIGFGGSYGGMLGAFFKFKYPHLITGVIAASAPIFSYVTDEWPANSYAKTVTQDAGPKCGNVVKEAFKKLYDLKSTGQRQLSQIFKTCNVMKTDEEVLDLIEYISGAFDYIAMGNYPYASSYVTPDGKGMLPGHPMKAACSILQSEGGDLLKGLAGVMNLYYNSSGTAKCFFNDNTQQTLKKQETSCEAEGSWDYQYCTQHLQPFEKGTNEDMYYPHREFNVDEVGKYIFYFVI